MSTIRARMGTLYLDNLESVEGAATLVVANTVPQNLESAVDIHVAINLQVVNTVGAAISGSRIQVYVFPTGLAEVLAYDTGAGGYQTGFAGTAVEHTSPGSGAADELWLSFAPTAWLVNDTEYTVRVETI